MLGLFTREGWYDMTSIYYSAADEFQHEGLSFSQGLFDSLSENTITQKWYWWHFQVRYLLTGEWTCQAYNCTNPPSIHKQLAPELSIPIP